MKKVAYSENEKKELTLEEIKAFKLEYGKVTMIKSVDEKYKCYLHTPTRIILDLADSTANKKDRVSAYNETLMKNCWLAGNKEMVEKDTYFFGAQKKLNSLVEIKEAELVEL